MSGQENIYNKGKVRSRTSRAGIRIPVGLVNRKLKEGHYSERIGRGAPVYLAAVIEYLVVETLELSNYVAMEDNKRRITPKHILVAVRNDPELDKLLSGVTIAQGGVLPNILPALQKKAGKSASVKRKKSSSSKKK